MAKPPPEPKHAAPGTATDTGHQAKHAKAEVDGYAVGKRRDEPHHPDGWDSSR